MNEKSEAKEFRVTWVHPVLGTKMDFVWAYSKSDVKRHIRKEFENAKIIEVKEWIKPKQPESKPVDMVNHPPHYTQGGIECINAIAAAVTGLTGMEAVCTGNIIRYIWRWKHKNGLEDVKKCRWFIDKLIAELEEQPNE